MLRFHRVKKILWNDHSELLKDPDLRKIVGRPKPQPRVRSQQPTTPAAPAAPTPPAPSTPVPTEDPLTRFRRMVEELVLRGVDYATAVQMIDQEHPDLRQRANELATARRDVAAGTRRSQAAAVRANRVRRFIARKGR